MKVFVLLNNTFEEIEALTVVDYLRRASIDVTTVSMHEKLLVKGGHNIEVSADITFDNLKRDMIDVLYIPGGLPAAREISENKEVIELVQYLKENNKIIAAMCAGPLILETSQIAKDEVITSFPGVKDELKSIKEYSEDVVVKSGNIITSRGPATAVFLALKLIEEIKGKEVRDKVAEGILFNYIEK
ncbi:DJ-1 family glyoxalase III [Helcococcus kunzii]|uniref:DJ-1 family protein n=1 Tax=Helcococcus kunzii ATCC 51366 TaxID=883114 RepID=H3NLZ7_9FIRM|nr:DJ-1 family glyoxalase III [Helcococcus kunzii]EHR35667.1 DJ-1 family protein [Helcococcus kunzii ATCC 51366]QZO76728.1 DJ-1/PfpI family protein [Helcococcus kunzii]